MAPDINIKIIGEIVDDMWFIYVGAFWFLSNIVCFPMEYCCREYAQNEILLPIVNYDDVGNYGNLIVTCNNLHRLL
jgi:hypothetical protein